MAGSKIKWREYLIELLVVIIGISIAFSIENYSANRKQKAQELQHLKGIVDDLETDERLFEEFSGYVANTLTYVKRLNQLIAGNELSNDSLNFLLMRAGWISNHSPRDISYASLKTSGGLDKLTNFELREKIVYHYEHKLGSVHFQNNIYDRYMEDFVTPIQLKYADFTSQQKVGPGFFENRMNKNVFAGLEGQLSNKVQNYKEAAEDTREILEMVRAEVSKF